MTCIVGLVENGKVYMGGDSAAACGLDVIVRGGDDTKIFKNDGVLMGYTTSFRMGQLLRYALKVPKQPKKMKDYEYMCTRFVKAVQDCFDKHKYIKKGEDGDTRGGTFLVGYKGNLYTIYDDYQVAISQEDFSACGCGTPFAMGAMLMLIHKNMSPKEKITRALLTAEHFSGGVRGPFKVKSIK